jgi:hypothetical protein
VSDEIYADPTAITAYAGNLSRFGMTATVQPMTDLAEVNMLALEAFQGITAAGQLAEAGLMIAAVQRNSDMFGQLVRDAGTGIAAIANAAQVCSDTYRTTDDANAAGLNAINYAFADPGAARPAGLSRRLVPGETIHDRQLAAAADARASESAQPDVLARPDTGTTAPSSGGATVTTYPDGSSRTAATTTSVRDGSVVNSTVLTGPNGAVLARTTDTTARLPASAGGGTVRTIENVDANNQSRGTVVTTAPNGVQTVQTTRDGKPTKDAPVTVAPSSAPDPQPEHGASNQSDVPAPSGAW